MIKAANEFKDKTTAINQLWQTDFTYLKITGWGWYYLSTVLDDFSRYIVTWRLGPTMCASDVTATLDQALAASGLDRATVMHRPRLLSDNGSSYVASDLAAWLEDKGMEHVRGAPYHPQTQGKIERWHQTLKNRILLDNYYLPGDLERQINAFVAHYNHVRYHESIDNLAPADVYFGRAETILAERQRIKRVTIANRRLQHQLQAAQTLTPDEPESPFAKSLISLKLSDDGYAEAMMDHRYKRVQWGPHGERQRTDLQIDSGFGLGYSCFDARRALGVILHLC